ncbi:MAG: cyclic nucleotide-binding domain-containing protein [Saccharofermentans sp.]|nr:cyclic nucleotide-binding domain-containing protein [Saccharofermentans sp.]
MAIVEKTFKSGEVIIREGEAGTTLFRLLSGNIGIYTEYGKKEQFRIAFLKSGGYFGEQAIIETSPRSATVVAECSVKVLEIPGNELTSLFEEKPEELLIFLKHLGSKVRNMINDRNEALNLLQSAREADAAKKKSIFAKFKRLSNQYQPKAAGFSEPNAETFRKEFEKITDEGPGRIVTHWKDDVIYNQGDTQDCMYIVRGGKVALYKNYGSENAEKVTELTDVSYFGEMGMILDEPRETTAVVESDEAYVEVIYKKDLEAVFAVCPVKIDMLLTHLSFRLRHLTIDFLEICKDITTNYS